MLVLEHSRGLFNQRCQQEDAKDCVILQLSCFYDGARTGWTLGAGQGGKLLLWFAELLEALSA